MAKVSNLPKTASHVIANNDVVCLWWSIPAKIKNCLGFSIHRIVDGREKALPAYVGFDAEDDPRKKTQTTDVWPIQSFNWKDVYAPIDKDIYYKIIPMVGHWLDLRPDHANTIVTEKVRRTQTYNNINVIFNRGMLSTQAVAKLELTSDQVRELISSPDQQLRLRLGGHMIRSARAFFKQDQDGGCFYAALYEFTDEELIALLTKNPKNHIILSNANGSGTKTVDGKKKTVTVIDKTNAKIRKALHKKMKQGQISVYDRMLGTRIGHNKFVIYVDKKNKPVSVLTGSTNWTPTGLCGQTNNMVIINSKKVATAFMDYWNQLKDDKNQDAVLRTWCNGKTFSSREQGNRVRLWFSPNTPQKTKPKTPAVPIDMADVFKQIQKAKKSILFLVFNPGSPSILDEIKTVADARKDKNPLFVRGAISDAKIAQKVITSIYSTDALERPDAYKVGRPEVTGVAAVPDTFSYWEKELLKLGFSTIHDKILVIDPFDTSCKVITGSHNLGYKASYSNDENMVILEGNPEIAKAYATHILDVVNHFKWRYKLQQKVKGVKGDAKRKEALETAWHDLDETDKWMNYYFSDDYIDRYRLFLR